MWFQVFLSNTNTLQTDLFDPLMRTLQVQSLRVIFPHFPELEAHHPIQFSVIPQTMEVISDRYEYIKTGWKRMRHKNEPTEMDRNRLRLIWTKLDGLIDMHLFTKLLVLAVFLFPNWLPYQKSTFYSTLYSCPVGWGCRIHRLLLCRGVRPPTSVRDMTLNNLMVRFQQCWSFGEYGVPLYCHRSQVHSGPEW